MECAGGGISRSYGLWEGVAVKYTDLPRAAAGRAGHGQGELRWELCCRAGLEVPDLCLAPVPGTVRPLDGKFLAGKAPGKQFE